MRIPLNSNEEDVYDNVCYLAQQSIEKLLKALCIERGIKFPHSHDLKRLVSIALPAFPGLGTYGEEFRELTELGLEFRYPDDFATHFEANRAETLCTKLRNAIRDEIGPSEGMLFP
jgi:HEPN domain-containing protein